MRINAETIALVKEFEGCELAAYRDAVGVWTIGYGHSERAPLPPKPYDGMVITMDQAHKILQDDLTHFGKSVENLISVPVTDNQFGAMVSLAFNIGLGAMA
jgi:lysozyme